MELSVSVDDEPWGEATAPQMRWGFPEILAYASLDEDVAEGDVLASGPFAGGCGKDAGHLPEPGSTLELEGTGLGALRTTIGPRPARPDQVGLPRDAAARREPRRWLPSQLGCKHAGRGPTVVRRCQVVKKA